MDKRRRLFFVVGLLLAIAIFTYTFSVHAESNTISVSPEKQDAKA